MKVLLGQLEPRSGDVPANTDAVCAAVAENPDADLAVFPELFLSGYHAGRDQAAAIAASDPAIERIAEVAARTATAVIVGFSERTPGGLANSVACIAASGELAGVYRKAQLFGGAEQVAFVAGDHLLVLDLDGRRVAPMICFDVEFPEVARAVSAAGAELLVTASANMEPYGPDHALHARARALDNRRPHVYVNRVGPDGDLHFVGESCVIRPDGSVVEQLGGEAELRVVDLDLEAWTNADVDYLPQIRALDVQVPARSR
jgi:predicted amidohydrolase